MSHKISLIALILVSFGAACRASSGSEKCEQTSYGECFSVHARYAVYTGDGMEVLWPVGTHRLFWAASGTDRLDAMLQNHLDDSYIFGDFVVCPLSKEIKGEMRHFCIREATHLKVVKRK